MNGHSFNKLKSIIKKTYILKTIEKKTHNKVSLKLKMCELNESRKIMLLNNKYLLKLFIKVIVKYEII